jgi:hypothetical protein
MSGLSVSRTWSKPLRTAVRLRPDPPGKQGRPVPRERPFHLPGTGNDSYRSMKMQ